MRLEVRPVAAGGDPLAADFLRVPKQAGTALFGRERRGNLLHKLDLRRGGAATCREMRQTGAPERDIKWSVSRHRLRQIATGCVTAEHFVRKKNAAS